jgi:hypothetical protein
MAPFELEFQNPGDPLVRFEAVNADIAFATKRFPMGDSNCRRAQSRSWLHPP